MLIIGITGFVVAIKGMFLREVDTSFFVLSYYLSIIII